VDWSNIKKDTFLSSSWDGNVKLVSTQPRYCPPYAGSLIMIVSPKWTPERTRSMATFKAHMSCVYQALFSPHQPDIIATCSTDGTIKIFDLRTPAYASGPATNSFTNPVSAAVLTVPASGTELLSLDWNKYRPFVIASAGVDKMVKVWDCRMASTAPSSGQAVGGLCELQVPGHEYAVRKVQWSPHRADILATASYDMTCRVYVASYYHRVNMAKYLDTAAGPQILHQEGHTFYTYTIPTPSLSLGAVGRCTTRVSLRVVVGTVD
jgi:peroxin-7